MSSCETVLSDLGNVNGLWKCGFAGPEEGPQEVRPATMTVLFLSHRQLLGTRVEQAELDLIWEIMCWKEGGSNPRQGLRNNHSVEPGDLL